FMGFPNKKFVMDRLISSTNSLLDNISNLNLITCIENMQKKTGILRDLEDITEFFTRINREDIFLTWDTSHSWTCDVDIKELWEKWHHIIKNVHIVDNTQKTSDIHPALGTGRIDLREIINLLKDYNYEGSLIIELGTAADSERSIEHVQKFL
ncbi:MAG: sugar phosphate isomerase/epimerase, partial [Promethearchaeota archaeon]